MNHKYINFSEPKPDKFGNINCVGCVGCRNCTNCKGCTDCTDCKYCIRCDDCHHCNYCFVCKVCTESDFCNNCEHCHWCYGYAPDKIYLSHCDNCQHCELTEKATFDVTHCENCHNLIDSHDCINCNSTATHFSKPSYMLMFCDHCDRCDNCFQCRNLNCCEDCSYLEGGFDVCRYYGAKDKFRKVRFSRQAAIYKLVPLASQPRRYSHYELTHERPTRLWQLLPMWSE